MAPSPENDNTPKAPDKNDKTKGEHHHTPTTTFDSDLTAACASDNKEASVSRLDDVELKALLDEAINYKIPKDRVGKSKLFQNLLEKAEEDDRKARATSASGSESVRYYNTTATHRNRRRREANSVSENLTHGGSLNNLAKEELYAAASHLNRPPKTVSARQRQGGSLPCNVNAGITTPSYDRQFFEEVRVHRTESKKVVEYLSNDMEADSLLEYDSLNQEYNEQPEIEVVQTRIPRLPVKYTSKFNIEIGGGSGGTSVDETVTVSALERPSDKYEGFSLKPVELFGTSGSYHPNSNYSPYMPSWPFTKKSVEDRKVDENGNALAQTNVDGKKNKKKKIQTDKNVVVVEASNVTGHRSDIINDLDKLVEYIRGEHEQNNSNAGKAKSNVHCKTKIQKTHFTGEDNNNKTTNPNKKQKTRCKSKSDKSNSLEEISISKLDDFHFSADSDGGKVPLRSTKSNADRPRERRSWANSESLPLHASAENLESADFRVVTKKKKSKKGRVGQRQQLNSGDFNRSSSPEPRRKSAGSVPHSDKSNDSSDVDSVHSLPIEHVGIDEENSNLPISYADIAKTSNSFEINNSRPKWNRLPSERRTKSVDKCLITVSSVDSSIEVSPPHPPVKKSVNTQTLTVSSKPSQTDSVLIDNLPLPPPEVRSVHNWPAINNQNYTIIHNHNNNNNINDNKSSSNVLLHKNNHKHNKHIKNNNIKNVQQSNDINAVDARLHVLQSSEQQNCLSNVQILPPNIPDVQTIEKLHFKQLQQMMQTSQPPSKFVYPPEIVANSHMHQQISVTHINNNNNNNVSMSGYGGHNMNMHYVHQQQAHQLCVAPQIEDCDSDRTNSRPPVVILSGGNNNKDVSGLTFGFEINEQLLSDDVCDIFTSRFIVPNIFHNHNHDKIVNFIGLAWEDIINQPNGRVTYYTDKL